MLSDASIKRAKMPPEQFPDSWFGAVPALAEVLTPVLDLKRFAPYLVTLADIQLTGSVNVMLRARYDDQRLEELTAGMMPAFPARWSLKARQNLFLNFLGIAPTVTYTTFFSVWAEMPTVAVKLAYGMSLNSNEQALADSLGLANSVEKGLLPLPLSQQIEREYHILGEETKARVMTLGVPNVDYPIESIYARANEILVLTAVAAGSGVAPTAAENTRFMIDRDDDKNHLDFPILPLSLLPGGEIQCFVPALHEIRVHAICSLAPPAPQVFRYTIQRVRLTNILRARFGLVTRDEIPGDTYDKVLGGLL